MLYGAFDSDARTETSRINAALPARAGWPVQRSPAKRREPIFSGGYLNGNTTLLLTQTNGIILARRLTSCFLGGLSVPEYPTVNHMTLSKPILLTLIAIIFAVALPAGTFADETYHHRHHRHHHHHHHNSDH